MPLPFILGVGAAIAGAVGIKKGVDGAVNVANASEKIKNAENRHAANIERFKRTNIATSNKMDELGTLELEILNEFKEFSDLIEKIQNRPQFKEYSKEGVTLPRYDGEEIKKVSIGANVILGGLGGAAVGTAGGFAAAGATTSAVMALGTASTGTAISSLSGAALTNATLAALGGGALHSSVFAGGMALGSTVLGAATLGVGLLVGGAIFGATGDKLSSQADEAYYQMKRAEGTINTACTYLSELENYAYKYFISLKIAYSKYETCFKKLRKTVNELNKTNWEDFTEKEKENVQNTVLLVGLLYKMCQVKLVCKVESGEQINRVNCSEIMNAINNSSQIEDEIKLDDEEPQDVVTAFICTIDYVQAEEYYYGTKGEKDFYKAAEFYKKAADLGHAKSMYYLANMFCEGNGVEKDYAKAYEWYLKAANHGNANAMASLGGMYEYGEGQEKDMARAYKWYYKAAIRKNAVAMIAIGNIFFYGKGKEKDYVKAFEWYLLAANKGFAVAMSMIGAMYYAGMGITQDRTKAKEWLICAAQKGRNEAKEQLKEWYGITV